jgi:uncharacterized protein HemY
LQESLTFERPKADEFFYNLGYCYFRNSEYGKAEEFLNKAIGGELHPATASGAHFYLGRLHYERGAFAKAAKEFELALRYAAEAGNSLKVIYGELAKSFAQIGQRKEASHYAKLAQTAD